MRAREVADPETCVKTIWWEEKERKEKERKRGWRRQSSEQPVWDDRASPVAAQGLVRGQFCEWRK